MKWYALLPIAAAISLSVRILPFTVGQYLRRFAFLHKLSVMLPGCLLVMIAAYTLHDVSFKEAPFGLPEIGALLGVILVQCSFRKITLSMLIGVALHQVLRVIFFTS